MRDTVNVRIPRPLWERIKQRAEKEERTVQTVVRKMLEYAEMMGYSSDSGST